MDSNTHTHQDEAKVPRTAYDEVGWDSLSPYTRQQIDEMATQMGSPLHAMSSADQLRNLIRIYRATSW